MEKEQIVDAYGVKHFEGREDGIDFWKEVTGEEYYKETYGGEN
jgi:hypothetical protein